MNISEANAMFRLLDWLGATRPMDPVTDGDVAEAWFLLAERAGKALQMPVTTRQVWEAFEAFGERLRGTAEAEAVCEALARHVAHGGVIPWPQVEVPFGNWAAARQEVST